VGDAGTRTGTGTAARGTGTASIGDPAVSDRAIGTPHGDPGIPQTRTSMGTEPRPSPAPPQFAPIVHFVDLFFLAGSTRNPDEELAAAAKIWSRCGIHFHGLHVTPYPYGEAETRALLATDARDQRKPLQDLEVVYSARETTQSVRNLRAEWAKKRTREIRSKDERSRHFGAFFVPKAFGPWGAPSFADPDEGLVYIGRPKHWAGFDLAHELGHLLLPKLRHHGDYRSSLMHPEAPGEKIVDLECLAARGDEKARSRVRQQSGDAAAPPGLRKGVRR
jgi:hypothetical protein